MKTLFILLTFSFSVCCLFLSMHHPRSMHAAQGTDRFNQSLPTLLDTSSSQVVPARRSPILGVPARKAPDAEASRLTVLNAEADSIIRNAVETGQPLFIATSPEGVWLVVLDPALRDVERVMKVTGSSLAGERQPVWQTAQNTRHPATLNDYAPRAIKIEHKPRDARVLQ